MLQAPAMIDIVLCAVSAAFFGLAIAYVYACERV
jgi:hypothetical protein